MFISINGGMLPQRQTTHRARFDVFANENIKIYVGVIGQVPLGIKLDESYFQNMFEKDLDILGSEEEAKKELDLFLSTHYFELHPHPSLFINGLNSNVHIIDMDYKYQFTMIIRNVSAISKESKDLTEVIKEKLNGKEFQKFYEIKKGDKVGQLIFKKHEGYLLPEKYTGGFGGTEA